MNFKLAFVLLIVPATMASVFKPCGNEPEPVSMKVDSCKDKYCELKHGVPAHMDMTFSPKADSDKLKAIVNAKFAGIWLPWSLGQQAKVCNYLSNGVKCPIKAQQQAIYSLNFTVPSIAPVGTGTTVKLSVVDGQKTVIACTTFLVKIVA